MGLIRFNSLLFVFFTLFIQAFSQEDSAPGKNIANLEFADFCKYFHYPVEVHYVTTEDGYILKFFRIQAKYQKEFKSNLPVVYFQHGLLDSSDTWITNDEDKAPGFVLANKGYDVWFGNSRGNKHSREHIYLKPKDPHFWMFSYQNMSKYDLPAAFEHIHKVTQQKINYIGHSQGTIIMFAALSEEDPTILKYLDKFIAVAPVAWVNNMTSPMFDYLAHSEFGPILEILRVHKLLEPTIGLKEVSFTSCKLIPQLCMILIGDITNTHPNVDNYKRFDVILAHEPGGTSLWNLLHWRQGVDSQCFCKFDYGKKGNLLHYGQKKPPAYDVSKIKVPVYLFAGDYDKLGDPTDVDYLKKHLTGSSEVYFKNYPFGHCTFVWGRDVYKFLDDLIDVLENKHPVPVDI